MKDEEEVGDLAADQDEQAEVGEGGLHLHHLKMSRYYRHHHLQMILSSPSPANKGTFIVTIALFYSPDLPAPECAETPR